MTIKSVTYRTSNISTQKGGFFIGRVGFEEADRAKRGKEYAGGIFFRPGENPLASGRSPNDCGLMPIKSVTYRTSNIFTQKGGFFIGRVGFEGADRAKRGKEYAGGIFFRPGENPLEPGRSPKDCRRVSIMFDNGANYVILTKNNGRTIEPMNILFDLDGTLTDSGVGIINCAIFALKHFDLPIPSREALRVFVGPPLRDTFPKFGVPLDRVDEAIALYRKRYTTVGKFENFPYPGIRELLETLKGHGHGLYVATSKPEHMAVEILEHFGLANYFDIICGATPDDSRSKKEDVIAYLLRSLPEGQEVRMIGDTIFDINGAAAHKLPAIGVAWGYGDCKEMMNAGAIDIANSPEELLNMIEKEAS